MKCGFTYEIYLGLLPHRYSRSTFPSSPNHHSPLMYLLSPQIVFKVPLWCRCQLMWGIQDQTEHPSLLFRLWWCQETLGHTAQPVLLIDRSTGHHRDRQKGCRNSVSTAIEVYRPLLKTCVHACVFKSGPCYLGSLGRPYPIEVDILNG
jgi:hypothetical protein